MKARLREILRCPACRGPLGDAADALRCAPCRTEYPVVRGVPIFIPADQLKTVENLPARSGYDPWLHYFTISSLPRSALILDIGAGDMGLDHPNIVRLDVFLSPHCDVVADAHHLPFTDGAFEFVCSLAVLEHLRQPFTAADEMHRVLRPGGYVYCDTSFLIAYHGFPHHYFNSSVHGIEQVFQRFHKLRVCVPPYQMPSFAIESLLGTYLTFFKPVTDAERQAVDSARALLALPWRQFDQHFPPEWAYTCSADICFYDMKGRDADCIPEPMRHAWAGRADLRQMFPVPEDLSMAPNLVSWFAETGRGQDPEVDACLDEDPLIPAASLNLAIPWSATTPGPAPLAAPPCPPGPPAGRTRPAREPVTAGTPGRMPGWDVARPPIRQLLSFLRRKIGNHESERGSFLSRQYAWGVFEGVEVEECGLIRIHGWSRGSEPGHNKLQVRVDDRIVPLAHAYRTYRPDVARALQSRNDFLGFAMEYLCYPRGLLPGAREACKIAIAYDSEEIRLADKKVSMVVPHYENLLAEENVLYRDHIYGYGPSARLVSVEVAALVNQWLDGSVIDFGCGAGALVKELRSRGLEAYGIEINRPETVGQLLEEMVPYITLYDGKLPLPYADDSFECGAAVEVLEHVAHYPAVVEELARIIRKRLVVTVPDMSAIPIGHRHNVVPWHLLESTHVNFFTQRSLRNALMKCFGEIEFARIGSVMVNGSRFYTSLVALCTK